MFKIDIKLAVILINSAHGASSFGELHVRCQRPAGVAPHAGGAGAAAVGQCSPSPSGPPQ